MAIVSIITATYNSCSYLQNYFRMLEQQTLTDWEAILVDDGSTDQTVAVIRQKAAKDSRYKLFEKTPEGFPSRSRAYGLAQVESQYVAFCDHDDLWAPQKLEVQIYCLKIYQDLAILHTDRIVWSQTVFPDPMPIFPGPIETIPVNRQRPEEVIYQGLQIIFSSFASRTDLVKQVGFSPDMKGVDDFYLFVRLASLGSIYHVDFPLTYYFAHQGNLSHSSQIFVRGFYDVHEALKHDSVPDCAKKSVLAQAMRTEAVSLMAINRPKAIRLLVGSLRMYFIPSTLNRLFFLLATFFVPTILQVKVMSAVKKLKFTFPTWKDLFR